MLKNSPRSCARQRSVNAKFLNSEKFQVWAPGPRITPRPEFPGLISPAGTLTKHEVLNHWATVCGAWALGSQIMSGRGAAALEPRMPRPAGSTLEVAAVSGEPATKLVRPETSQPASAYFLTPAAVLNMGNS